MSTSQELSSIIVYTSEDGSLKLDALLQNGSLWLTQSQIAQLFGTSTENIIQHIRNIYDEGELDPDPTMAMIPLERMEGTRTVRRTIQHYNLDMIISVGYRVQSRIATRFRQWATQRLVEYVVKGFTLDDESLKNPNALERESDTQRRCQCCQELPE